MPHVFLFGGSLIAASATASAQIWNGSSSGSWNTAANWSSNSVPGANAAVTFYGTGAANLSTTSDAPFTLNSITFNSTASSPVTVTVTASPTSFDSGTAIRFNGGQTNISVAAGDHKIVGSGVNSGGSYDVIFNGTANSTHTFSINNGASFEIQGRMHQGASSNKSYVKTGGGTLIFSGANGGGSSWQIDASKSFEIQQGALRFAATNAGGHSGNNFLVSSGAVLELTGDGVQTSSNGTYTLNGTGIGGNGAIRSLSGDNTISAANTATGTILLNSSSSIGVDAGTLTIKKVVSGSGSLTKTGAGTLVLDGTYSDNSTTFANTYTGGTVLNQGTLTVGSNGNLGAATGSLSVNNTNSAATGTNSILNLPIAANITVGSLSGTIATPTSGTNTATINTQSGQTFTVNQTTNATYAGVIAGTGNFTLGSDSSHVLTLTGANTYTGTTTIASGILQIGDGGTAGTLGNSNTSINSGAELRINRSTDSFGYSYTRLLSGDGTVNILSSRRFNFQTNNQTSSGSLSFTVNGTLGINTGSGVNDVHLGELSGSGTIQRAGSGTDPATLRVGGKNTNSTFSGLINASGFSVEKMGTGTLTLTRANTYTGGTTVSNGTLLVNNTSGSGTGSGAVNVNQGATLGGSGIISGATTISGTLAPGNSPGVLTAPGGITFQTGSVFEWELDLSQSNPETNRGVAYDGVNTSSVSGAGAVFLVKLTGSQDFSDTFWNQSRQWTDIFKIADGSSILTAWASVFGGGFQYTYNGNSVAPSTQGAFTLSGNTLNWSPVPEPGNALAGLLVAAGLLRRRR